MAKERKMICECGGGMKPTNVKWFGVLIPGRKCTLCKEETISSTQSKNLERQVRLRQALQRSRKIVRVGNAMGITLPEELRTIGFKIGKRVKTELLDEQSFKVIVQS